MDTVYVTFITARGSATPNGQQKPMKIEYNLKEYKIMVRVNLLDDGTTHYTSTNKDWSFLLSHYVDVWLVVPIPPDNVPISMRHCKNEFGSYDDAVIWIYGELEGISGTLEAMENCRRYAEERQAVC